MKYKTALSFYKTGLAIAAALQVRPQAVYQWKRRGVVPIKSAMRLERQSRGKIRVDSRLYDGKVPPSSDHPASGPKEFKADA
jgi:DNA-binding transcriptional regulator Cro